MKTKEITEILGLTNINDEEFNVFAAIGTPAEDLVIIDNMLSLMRTYQLMNKRKGVKIKLKQMLGEYINNI
ncbi:MAG: hypothetical protein LBE11_00180 [Prevotellaceae bacterium]|jgi:hypothetical protein|nr:hypothetical protein [Prevotellaceae bacterium]